MSVVSAMSDVLEEAASLILGELDETVRVRRHQTSHADYMESVFVQTLGSERPAQWLSQAIGYYLADCAYQLRGLALLLREVIVGGSLESLARGVVERVGRIMWLLDLPPVYEGANLAEDETKDPMVHAVRSSFEALVCTQLHRRGVAAMRAPKEEQNLMKKLERSIRGDVQKWFKPIQPLMDENDPDSFNPTASTWTIRGETYPNFSELAEWSLAGGKVTAAQAKGSYAALSAWSHPNFIAATRTRASDHRYVYDFVSVRWLLTNPLFGYFYALKGWSGYYDFDAARFEAECDRLVSIWQAIEPSQDDN